MSTPNSSSDAPLDAPLEDAVPDAPLQDAVPDDAAPSRGRGAFRSRRSAATGPADRARARRRSKSRRRMGNVAGLLAALILTGAVYSASDERLRRAEAEFFVGNLYLNRKCTGAMVGAHPFGGFNMSGTDSKAGGPDYLLLFTQAKSIAEKITSITPSLGE